MIKAIIFDVDGVLLDTVPYHFEAWKRMFAELSITITYDDYLTKLNGIPRLTGIRNIVPIRDAKELEQLAQIKQRYFLNAVADNPPMPLNGVLDFLHALGERGIKKAAASSSKNAPSLLRSAGISPFLDATVGGADFKDPKPAPDIFLTAAALIDTIPSECMVIEDAAVGIVAAKNAGMTTMGLTRSEDLDIIQIADRAIRSLEEFRKILPLLNG